MQQKFKHKLLHKRKCINAIMRFYNLALPHEVIEGMTWYNDAKQYAKELAARFNLSVSQVVGIIAAFSPQSGWQENKRYALSFFLNPKSVLRSQVQIQKAKNILTMNCETNIYNALSINDAAWKTKAFFLNILNPDLFTSVTIDRHAIAICIQTPDTVESLSADYGKLTKHQYTFFEGCYISAAKELNILPQQMQAIVWTVYRRLRELKQHDTTNDWKPFNVTF